MPSFSFYPEELRFYPDDFLRHGPKVRYNPVETKLPWSQTLALLLHHGIWCRTRKGFSDPIYPGEPGYEDAVYEATYIYNRQEMERLSRLHPLN